MSPGDDCEMTKLSRPTEKSNSNRQADIEAFVSINMTK